MTEPARFVGIDVIPAPEGTTYSISGKEYPVKELVKREGGEYIPIVDVPMMSDYRQQQLALEQRIEHPENYRIIEDVDATIAYLRQWLKDHRGEGA